MHSILTRSRAAVPFVLACACAGAQPGPVAPGDLVPDTSVTCGKPAVAPPPPLKEAHARYQFRRRLVDLDGSGRCVVMDFWVERLGDSDAPGQRTLEHRFLRLVGRKWTPFETDLAYFPRLMRSPGTGQRYLVVLPDDTLDDMAGGGIEPAVYTRGGWKAGVPGMVDTYEVHKVKPA